MGEQDIDWELMAKRRMRLVWAALFVGVLLGVVLHAFMSMPPVWIDDLP